MRPTCCLKLRNGIFIIALGDIVFSLAATILSIGALSIFELNREPILDIFENPPEYLTKFLDLRKLGSAVIRVFLAFNAFYWLQKIWLGSLLLLASVQESERKCRLWFLHTFVLLVLSVVSFLAAICMEVVQPLSIPFYVAAFVVREYVVWVVFTYMRDLQIRRAHHAQSVNVRSNGKILYKL